MGSIDTIFGNFSDTVGDFIDAGLGSFQSFFDVISGSLGAGE